MIAEPRTRRVPPKKQRGQGRGPRTLNGALLDVHHAALFLGGSTPRDGKEKTNEKQIRRLVARQLIPYRRIGARIMFLRHELEQWIEDLPGITLDEAHRNAAVRRGEAS